MILPATLPHLLTSDLADFFAILGHALVPGTREVDINTTNVYSQEFIPTCGPGTIDITGAQITDGTNTGPSITWDGVTPLQCIGNASSEYDTALDFSLSGPNGWTATYRIRTVKEDVALNRDGDWNRDADFNRDADWQ